ncbi:MAG: exo-alpha-sialidase [Prevotella sp.]|nr:exo-alpha-sialidase [Prevotella sp.]
MKRKLFATIALLTCALSISAQSAVGVGAQVTSESDIEIGKSYVLQSQAANTPYIADAGSYYNIPNNNPAKEDCVYQFIPNGDGTWKIKSVYTGRYWGVPVYNQALAPAEESAAGAWSLNFSSGIAYPTAPDANNETRGLDRSSQRLWGYTTGTGGTKQVKIYQLSDTPPVPLSDKVLDELSGKTISVAENPADNLTTGQWYVMFDRGTQPKKHGYLYEDVSKHSLYNTATVPSGNTTTAAKYLVRLVDAGDGKFYIQTGFGNYIGAFEHKQNVPVTAQPQEKLIVEKIANTDGHFYVQSTSTNVVLNANDVGSGDATVVGWNTTVPTAIDGNNDWAFYPVTLEDFDPVTLNDVAVTRGYQTCGRGNENSLMLRIDLTPSLAISDATINVSLNAAAVANLSNIYIYETTAKEFIANIPSSPIATATVGNTVSFNIGNVSEGLHHFWLCATVKDNAELGAILEATLTGITYTCLGSTNTLTVPASKTPSRQGMKVFNQQTFVFKPTTDNNRFYRIPAMILDKNGDLVVAIDRRYNDNSDLGNHKIDVSIKRSEDNGRTWGAQNIVAVGNTAIEARYGYGDAALARTKNGRIICLMACGKNNYFGTGGYSNGTHYNKWVGMLTSDDNGVTWQGNSDGDPILITEDAFGGRGQSVFVTSGKGLTTEDGTVMFAVNVKRTGNNTSDCYILATEDEGETWTLLPTNAYSGCDESKLEQMNDGSLLLSVRQSGNRGWNKGSADGMTWGSQYKTADITGNACNADILYYSRTTKGAKRDILLHSYINSSDRESLQLAMSIDGGESWHDVYNIQPNGATYSTMQKLNDGSLAILYEDASFNTVLSDPFKAGNGFAINFITVTKEQIENWYDELVSSFETPGVIIVEHGKSSGNAPFVTWNPSSGWANQFTTNSATGYAGVVVSATYNAFNRQGGYDQRVLCFKPSAAGAKNDIFTITAPDGYVIEGYSIGGYFETASQTYTLTAENGSSVAINKNKSQQNPPNFLEVTDINAKSTTFTMSNNNSENTKSALITQFIVYLKAAEKSIVLLDDDRGAEYPNADRISDNLSAATADVTLFGRTLYKDESWNTLCLPFAVNSFYGTPLEGAEVRTLKSASFSNGTLTLNFTDGLDAMEAGKPYIVRWDSGDDLKNPEFTGVQLSDATPEIVFDNIGMTFKGVYSPFAFEAQDKSKLYMGSANTLYYPKKAMTIKAFRAFFDLGSNLIAAEPSANAGAKEITNFVLNFGETTSLNEELRMKSEESVGDWYSIDGRRLQGEPTAKGVYIYKGKKVIK